MSTEIGDAITVVSPRTGEVIDLAAPDADLAGFLVDVREHESLLREAKNIVQRELPRRMDHAKKWTVHVPGFKLTGQSPKPEESWDGLDLRQALSPLVDRGDLSVEALDAAVETIVDYKVHKRGINALRAGGGEAAEIVDRLVQRSDPDRRVSVGRA